MGDDYRVRAAKFAATPAMRDGHEAPWPCDMGELSRGTDFERTIVRIAQAIHSEREKWIAYSKIIVLYIFCGDSHPRKKRSYFLIAEHIRQTVPRVLWGVIPLPPETWYHIKPIAEVEDDDEPVTATQEATIFVYEHTVVEIVKREIASYQTRAGSRRIEVKMGA